MDHYIDLARDAVPAHVQQLSDEIATHKRTCPEAIGAPTIASDHLSTTPEGKLAVRDALPHRLVEHTPKT